MRRLTVSAVLALLLLSLSVAGPRAVAAPAEPAAPQGISPTLPDGVRFLHRSTAGNVTDDYTVITNPASDNTPQALIFATHNWNPGGEGGTTHDHPVGTDFHGTVASLLSPAGIGGHWGLFNEDGDTFDADLAFNVMITPAGDRAFLQTSSGDNIGGDATFIDNAWLNGHLDRVPFIMHNYSPNTVNSGIVVTHPLGIYYDGGGGHWAIFNEDAKPMETGVSFNVMVGLPGVNVFTHTATVTNTDLNYTVLDNPLANGNRNALILITQNWNPDGGGGVYNPNNVGVMYLEFEERWAIFNEDSSGIPLGASFSVLVDEAHVYLPLALR